MLKLVDEYTIKARIAPFVLLVTPLFVSICFLIPLSFTIQFSSISMFLILSISILMSQISRDAGKSREKLLWDSWGGPPTIRFLRHSNTEFNPVIKAKCHKKIEKIFDDIKVPSPDKEKKNPKHSDEIFDAFYQYLITKTRDSEKFPIIFQENINYGFLRNLWGLKMLGLVFSVAGILLSVPEIVFIYKTNSIISGLGLISLSADFCFLLIWLFWVSACRIKIAADSYARLLLESCDEV